MRRPAVRFVVALSAAVTLGASQQGDARDAKVAAPAKQLKHIEVAESTQHRVLHVTWVPRVRPQAAQRRCGWLWRTPDLVVVAGPVAERAGRWLVAQGDAPPLAARAIGTDTESGLTLLRVPRALAEAAAAVEGAQAPEPAADPRGASIALLAADGGIALGAIRAMRRYVRWSRRGTLSHGLLEASLVTVPEDLGAPWLDDAGRMLALHAGTRDAPRRGRVRVLASKALGIPRAVIEVVAPLLLRHGRVPRGRLGAHTQPVSEVARAQLGIEGGHVVVALDARGPAEQAGLQVHDLIEAVAGRDMPRGASLADALLPFRPGDRVALRLRRAGKRIETQVVLGERAKK